MSASDSFWESDSESSSDSSSELPSAQTPPKDVKKEKKTLKKKKVRCNRCKGDRSVTNAGVFHKHHLKFEEQLPRPASCPGSLESPTMTFNGETWGFCKECKEVFTLIDNPKVVELHYWGLMCPGSRKKPDIVEEKPKQLVLDQAKVDYVGEKLGKLKLKPGPKSSPK